MPAFPLPWWQNAVSYLFPVKIATFPGQTVPELHLYRYCGRWQLGASTAFYSDGHKYRPLTLAFGHIKNELRGKKTMLVLGAGLGSALSVLQHMGIPLPETVLVDLDEKILELGKQLSFEETKHAATWICANAEVFVQQETRSFDLLIVDIFADRSVPKFAEQAHFLARCAQMLSAEGVFIMNYIRNNAAAETALRKTLESVFGKTEELRVGINSIFICRP